MTRRVLIGGLNRSGTSLARQIVGSHPAIALPPTELGFFDRFPHDRRLRDTAEARRLAEEVIASPKVAEWGLDRQLVLEAVGRDPAYKTLFLALVDGYAAAVGKPIAGEKTTRYEFHLRTLDRWLGADYLFVHVIRHPYATFASSRWYGGVEHPLAPGSWSRLWTRSVSIGLRMSARRPDRYLLVRYEDLVVGPDGFAAKVCGLLDVEPEVERMVAMADFEEKENSSFAERITSATYDGAVRRVDDLDRSALVSERERDVIAAACGGAARRAGYEIPPSRRPRLGLARRRFRFPAR